ncbi:MAG: hypothetical protein AABO57_16270 [Acidobacteriota bacterium]
MHHVRKYRILEKPDGFDVIYSVDSSREKITLNIPRRGVLEDPERTVNREQVENVARKIGETLSHDLTSELDLLGLTNS